jgi:hypothetical protein
VRCTDGSVALLGWESLGAVQCLSLREVNHLLDRGKFSVHTSPFRCPPSTDALLSFDILAGLVYRPFTVSVVERSTPPREAVIVTSTVRLRDLSLGGWVSSSPLRSSGWVPVPFFGFCEGCPHMSS